MQDFVFCVSVTFLLVGDHSHAKLLLASSEASLLHAAKEFTLRHAKNFDIGRVNGSEAANASAEDFFQTWLILSFLRS